MGKWIVILSALAVIVLILAGCPGAVEPLPNLDGDDPDPPVVLALAEPHSFDGVEITFEEVCWRESYDVQSGQTQQSLQVVLTIRLENKRDTAVHYGDSAVWGHIIESPGLTRVDCQFTTPFDGSDTVVIANGGILEDTLLFDEVDPGSTGFVFCGTPPLMFGDEPIEGDFELQFTWDEVVSSSL